MNAVAERHDVSRHKCLIYDGDPSEQLPVVVPLLLDGLRENWRCLYLGSPEAVRMIDGALASKGIDTERERDRSALVLSSDRSHLDNGKFDPEAMIGGLRSSVDDAVRDGFQGLCATGDMRWELGPDESFDRLVEYEALLEDVIRQMPLRGICQYHRALLPPAAVHDALITHRAAYVGNRLNVDNLYYVPPEVLLEARRAGNHAKQGEWMCQQILRVLDAERARDEVLRDLEARVAARTAELAVANRHLQAFSYSVSHDLRAPLRAILGFGSELAERAAERHDPEDKKMLGRVLDAGHRMNELIDGMLMLGRVVEADLAKDTVNVSTLASEVVRELRASEPSRSANVDIVIEPELHAFADRVLLRSVFENLLGNAWKFSSQRPRARIEVGVSGESDGAPIFFVRDNGAGFDMRHAERLFGVFQRLHRQDQFAGTGVGLATVERIIARHGGRIWAESTPDQGATFFFTLPA